MKNVLVPRISCLLSILLLAGCTGEILTSHEPAPTLYMLHRTDLKSYAVEGKTVEVLPPHMAEGLKTDRIALVRQGRQMDYFADGRWAGDLKDVIEETIVESLNTMPGMIAVNDENYSVNTDYRVAVDVNRFYAEYSSDIGSAPQVHIALRFILLSRKDESIVSVITYDEISASPDNSLTSITATSETLMGKAVSRLAAALRDLPPDHSE